MLRFIIKPADLSFPDAEIVAHDAAGVLILIERMGCKAADVERDGAHAFSVRLADSGLWSISRQRLRQTATSREAG